MKKYNRQDLVLKYIIEMFVKTAQPISSKNLIKEYNLDYSSATIRNEMQLLEQEGLLEKTHSSSGRVPSAKGYRYYIEKLRDLELSKETKHQLQMVVNNQNSSVHDVLRHSCAILSEMTALTSIMIGPDKLNDVLTRFEFMPIDDRKSVCVFVTSSGYVEHKVFNIPEGIENSDLKTSINILNDRLIGTPIYNLVEKMLSLRPVLALYIEQYEVLIKALVEMFDEMNHEDSNVWGTSNLLDQPEYLEDREKLKKMVQLIESNNVWKFIVTGKDREKKINIQVGMNEELSDVSIVSTDIELKGSKKGKIALIGPKRMDYSKVIGALEYLLSQLDLDYETQIVINKEKENEK